LDFLEGGEGEEGDKNAYMDAEPTAIPEDPPTAPQASPAGTPITMCLDLFSLCANFDFFSFINLCMCSKSENLYY
jgi:hypothetical protein